MSSVNICVRRSVKIRQLQMIVQWVVQEMVTGLSQQTASYVLCSASVIQQHDTAFKQPFIAFKQALSRIWDQWMNVGSVTIMRWTLGWWTAKHFCSTCSRHYHHYQLISCAFVLFYNRLFKFSQDNNEAITGLRVTVCVLWAGLSKLSHHPHTILRHASAKPHTASRTDRADTTCLGLKAYESF